MVFEELFCLMKSEFGFVLIFVVDVVLNGGGSDVVVFLVILFFVD